MTEYKIAVINCGDLSVEKRQGRAVKIAGRKCFYTTDEADGEYTFTDGETGAFIGSYYKFTSAKIDIERKFLNHPNAIAVAKSKLAEVNIKTPLNK